VTVVENDAATRIETKLDAIIRLLAVPMVQGKTLGESAQLLARVGLNSEQIAELCGATPGGVRTVLSRARREASSDRRGPGSKRAASEGIPK